MAVDDTKSGSQKRNPLRGNVPLQHVAACRRTDYFHPATVAVQPGDNCFENGVGRPRGHRQKQSLLCVLPRRERPSVVPSGAPGHPGLRAHGTRREPTFDGGRLVAVYGQDGPFS